MIKIIKQYVLWQKYDWDDEPKFVINNHSMTGGSGRHVVVGEQEFSILIPDDFDPITGIIDNLRKEKKNIQANCQMALNKIDEQIQSLLAIEHKQ